MEYSCSDSTTERVTITYVKAKYLLYHVYQLYQHGLARRYLARTDDAELSYVLRTIHAYAEP